LEGSECGRNPLVSNPPLGQGLATTGRNRGDEEIKLTKRAYGWPEDAQFLVPEGVPEHLTAGIGARGAAARQKWLDLLADYRAKYPALAPQAIPR